MSACPPPHSMPCHQLYAEQSSNPIHCTLSKSMPRQTCPTRERSPVATNTSQAHHYPLFISFPAMLDSFSFSARRKHMNSPLPLCKRPHSFVVFLGNPVLSKSSTSSPSAAAIAVDPTLPIRACAEQPQPASDVAAAAAATATATASADPASHGHPNFHSAKQKSKHQPSTKATPPPLSPSSPPPPPPPRNPPPSTAASDSTALERDDAAARYIDLRTLQKVPWPHVRYATSGPAPGCRFGPCHAPIEPANIPSDLLFGPDTINLSPPQQAAVRALLSRRSVLYSSILTEFEPIVLDIVLRAREWSQTVVHCAPTRRAAEAMYALMRTHLHDPDAVALDLGYETSSSFNQPPAVVITLPHVLRRAIIDMDAYWWMQASDMIFLDGILTRGISEWEEVLLGLPSRVLVCIFASDLAEYERDELPLWFETMQNSVVPISPPDAFCLWDRIDRPSDKPLFRAFVFNAAEHKHPIQVSLPLLAQELKKEMDMTSAGESFTLKSSRGKGWTRSTKSKPTNDRAQTLDDLLPEDKIDYSGALLYGVQVLPADDVNELSFEHRTHALYADLAAIVVADAKESVAQIQAKSLRRKSSRTDGKKAKTSVIAAATRRRRRAESVLIPAIAFVHGRSETESAAGAVLSALRDYKLDLVYDEDASELLDAVLREFVDTHRLDLTSEDEAVIAGIEKGVGVVHAGVVPALRMLCEELFRDGLVSMLVVDSYLGPREVSSLPRARSVLMQASCLAEQSDGSKGLISGTLASNLAGRPGFDEVGNLVALWFDEEVQDNDAAAEIAGCLLLGNIRHDETQLGLMVSKDVTFRPPLESVLDIHGTSRSILQYQKSSSLYRRSGRFLGTYQGLLGTLRRHYCEGYQKIMSYTLVAYRGRLVASAVRATRQKLEHDKKAVDEKIADVNWDDLGLHDRLQARLSEHTRLYESMLSRTGIVLAERMFEELRSKPAGALIGLNPSKQTQQLGGRRLLSSAFVPGRSSGSREEHSAPTNGAASGESSIVQSQEHYSVPVFMVNGGDESSWVPAILVAVYDASQKMVEVSPVQSSILVICITLDGLWTLVPLNDVQALDSKNHVISGVDQLVVPHLATFDLDPCTEWAKCRPFSDSEIELVSAAVDSLILELTSQEGAETRFRTLKHPEISRQLRRVENARRQYDASPWRGKEAEMAELRRARRRSAKLRDDIESLLVSGGRLESTLSKSYHEQEERLKSQMAVLEDCNSITVSDEGEMRMTPIGIVASVLPGANPLFAAACLVLVSSLDQLSPAQLGAFLCVVSASPAPFISTKRPLSSKQEERSNSIGSFEGDISSGSDEWSKFDELHGAYGGESSRFVQEPVLAREVDDLENVLPDAILKEMDDIRRALRSVGHRHFNVDAVNSRGPQIAPSKLETGSARVVYNFIAGIWTWVDVVRSSEGEVGELVSMFRCVLDGLNILCQDDVGLSELADLKACAEQARAALCTWPISDVVDFNILEKHGVGSRRFGITNRNATYKSWWARVKDEIESSTALDELSVQPVQAEVVTEVDDD